MSEVEVYSVNKFKSCARDKKLVGNSCLARDKKFVGFFFLQPGGGGGGGGFSPNVRVHSIAMGIRKTNVIVTEQSIDSNGGQHFRDFETYQY